MLSFGSVLDSNFCFSLSISFKSMSIGLVLTPGTTSSHYLLTFFNIERDSDWLDISLLKWLHLGFLVKHHGSGSLHNTVILDLVLGVKMEKSVCLQSISLELGIFYRESYHLLHFKAIYRHLNDLFLVFVTLRPQCIFRLQIVKLSVLIAILFARKACLFHWYV